MAKWYFGGGGIYIRIYSLPLHSKSLGFLIREPFISVKQQLLSFSLMDLAHLEAGGRDGRAADFSGLPAPTFQRMKLTWYGASPIWAKTNPLFLCLKT